MKHPAPLTARHARAAGLVLLCCAQQGAAQAWTLNIAAASRRVYLHVGNGTAERNNAAVNLVQVTVPGAQLGNGTALAMTSNSTQSNSLSGDNYLTCATPANQMLIGASYRRSSATNGPASATLRVTSPASLTTTGGDTIPFSQISWTVAAPGSPTPNVIPAGTFNGATQTLTTVAANTFIENCHSFRYANSAVRAAGTYNGQVTYTLSSP